MSAELRKRMDTVKWSISDLAFVLGKPRRSISEVVTGKRAVSAHLAKALASAFECDPEVFLDEQIQSQLSRARASDNSIENRFEEHRK